MSNVKHVGSQFIAQHEKVIRQQAGYLTAIVAMTCSIQDQ
jgi:hypothetical protein